MKELICQWCDNPFVPKYRNYKQKTCSKSCGAKLSANTNPSTFKKGVTPWNKGLPKEQQPHYGKHLSDETKTKISIGNKKENPKSSRVALLRKSNKFKAWRKAVFERDDFTCQTCGVGHGNKIRTELHPHHIKPVATNIELIFEVDNGITLCASCHGKEHGIDFTTRKNKTAICPICGDEFEFKHGNYRQKTCSRSCGHKLQALNGKTKKGKKYPHLQRARVGSCAQCGKEFRATKDCKDRKQKYCCRECYLKHRWNPD